ncbi:MAG: ThiF family adenylyltransferase, partial [Rhodospirillales bacterium]|nr:ThiF family adenylyltransferase [Rhodospirillales bacterium]
MTLTDDQLTRHARHILLPEIGGAGLAKIMNARVLVVGAGGLGSPVILYLAAAGVGTIGIIDDDIVELSNLQRQIVHTTDRIGSTKAESAKKMAAAVNPDITVIVHAERLTAENARDIMSGYDFVADSSDNFATRFLTNDACYFFGKTLVSAAILRFDGQLSTFKAHDRTNREQDPCYRCLFPAAPPPDTVPTCAEAGVLGALCGVLGSLQATELLKEITGAGVSMSGALLIVDG